ncbi:MAG: response regulator transcription factor [Chloroflexota bacterium]|nr:response regulator transcription factor [Chloroflexota bacterium]
MSRLLIVAGQPETVRDIRTGLAQNGFLCRVVPNDASAPVQIAEARPDAVLVVLDGPGGNSAMRGLVGDGADGKRPPVIALLSRNALAVMDSAPEVDDFVLEPWDTMEVAMRTKRVLKRANGSSGDDPIECGELVIDPARCEVLLAGEALSLTFREYELLKFLVSNSGKVFSRDTLLNRVWGYDYYGGDRTVDVHVRRLRGKLGESGESVIETVRNIGYRCRGA